MGVTGGPGGPEFDGTVFDDTAVVEVAAPEGLGVRCPAPVDEPATGEQADNSADAATRHSRPRGTDM